MKMNAYFAAPLIAILLLASSCQKQQPQPSLSPIFEELEVFKGPAFIKAHQGPIKYEGRSFGWLNTQGGSIELNGVNVSRGLRTDRDLYAENSILADLKVGGRAWIDRTTVTGKAHIGAQYFGGFKAKDSFFEGPVEVYGNILVEKGCFNATLEAYSSLVCLCGAITGPIEVHSLKNCSKPVVKLSENTLVNGDIWFENENGIVIVDETSYVNGGVIGGTVITE